MSQYGFYTENYITGSIETLGTGDGKTQFTDLKYADGSSGIGISYGLGAGINTKTTYPDKTLATEVGVQWQIKFECTESIDAMIETLERVKARLSSQPPRRGNV